MNERQYESLLRSAEKMFTVVMLFYTTGAVMPFIVGEVDQLSARQLTRVEFAVRISLYSVAFCFIAIRWRRVIQGARRIKWIVALVMFAIASAAWSQDPSLTLRSSVSVLATTAFGVYFGTCYTVPQQLRLLAWTCFFVVSLSFFFAAFFPGYGVDQGALFGAWQGVFVHKNALARATVLAVLVFLFGRPNRFHSLRWLGVAASLVLLFLSRSMTGMIVCLGIIATLPAYKLIRARLAAVIPVSLGIALLLGGLLLVSKASLAEALQLVGRSPDLTGRIGLWDFVLHSISKRPWLGYGFDAFWQGTNGESGSVVDTVGWAGYGHNGFLDLMLHLGALGLATFAIGYLVVWRRALALVSRATGAIPIWLCTYLVFMVLYNLTESSVLTPHSIYWVLYTSSAVSLFPASFRQLCTSPSG